jgi:ribonucleoside-diphosphate reductase alpha chain
MSQATLTAKQQDAADTSELESLRTEVDQLRKELEEAKRGPHRKRLPDTRDSVTHKFSISGHEGYLTAGLYPNASPGEVFIKMAKQGSTVSGLVDTIAVLISVALQYGVPLESLVRKFEHTRFEPSGDTTNREIRSTSSIADYIFTWLGLQFSEEFRSAHASRQTEQ